MVAETPFQPIQKHWTFLDKTKLPGTFPEAMMEALVHERESHNGAGSSGVVFASKMQEKLERGLPVEHDRVLGEMDPVRIMRWREGSVWRGGEGGGGSWLGPEATRIVVSQSRVKRSVKYYTYVYKVTTLTQRAETHVN